MPDPDEYYDSGGDVPVDEEAFHEDAETINQPSEAAMTERALQSTDNIDNVHVTGWMGRTETTRSPEDLRISSDTGPEPNTYTRRYCQICETWVTPQFYTDHLRLEHPKSVAPRVFSSSSPGLDLPQVDENFSRTREYEFPEYDYPYSDSEDGAHNSKQL